ncbi:MAG: ABC transporter permease [Longimicrobiales bacterium]
MHSLMTDLRYAVRSFLRTPGFTVTAVLALALGLGLNTAIFSAINMLLLKPLEYRDAERLVMFWDNRPQEGRLYNEVTPANVVALRASAAYETVGVFDFAGWTLTGSGEPEQLNGFVVSHEILPMLGIEPVAGRLFNAADDRAGAPPVALLSEGIWRRRFEGDNNIIGRRVLLDGQPVTIAGVFPSRLHLAAPADLLMPLAAPDSLWQARNTHILRVIGKLRSDVSMSAARAELNVLSTRLERDHPDTHTGWRMSLHSMTEGLQQGPVKPIMAVLFAAVGFVLLIACADVANLLLARSAPRRREVAIRTAIGASRGRLVRQMLTESLLLAVVGGLLGLVIAVWVLAAISGVTPPSILQFVPRLADLSIDRTALLYNAGLCALTALLFGLAPALRSSRADLSEALKERDRGHIPGRSRHRLSGSLVVLELALSLVLVIGAALMVQSLVKQQRANPGFQADNLFTAQIAPNPARYNSAEAMRAFQRELLARTSALREVVAAATVNALPLSGEAPAWQFGIPGRTFDANDPPSAQARLISAAYFDVMGLPLLRGRAFTDLDREGTQPVAVVSRSFAARYFPDQNAVGQRLTIPQEEVPREIVGVVSDVHDWRLGFASGSAAAAFIYVPHTQRPRGVINLIVHARAADAAVFAALRRTLFQLDPEQPLFQTSSMRELVNFSLFSQSITTTLLGLLALVALVLAICGVYGVMAYAVTQRTYEFGVRQALGATRAELLLMVLRQGAFPVGLGLLGGLTGAVLLAGSLRRLLFGVEPVNPVTFGGAALILALVSVLATAIPALRATRVAPVTALRSE